MRIDVKVLISRFGTWIHEPSSIAGVGIILGAIISWLTKTNTFLGAIGIAVGGVIAMLLPDNSALRNVASVTVTDAVKAAPGGVKAVETAIESDMPTIVKTVETEIAQKDTASNA